MVGTGAPSVRRRVEQGDVHVQVATRPAPVVVLGLLSAGLLCAGVTLAGPAAAVDHAALPDTRVTHGPSCRPGGVVVEVTAGTVGYAVTLATARRPAGEDAAEVAPGTVVVLRTGPVDWGETVDPYLEYTPLDGSGPAYVDGLAGFDFTRPSSGECAALAGPVVPAGPPREGAAAGSPAAVTVAAQQGPAGEDGGSRWPLLAAGGAVLAAGAGVAVVSGGRRPGGRPRSTPPFGSA
ncbi:hypothetical protein SAMN06893096_10610 [Geodermatophilus pulveris]|uniref:Uncharacterized protein n=1 Tax=Geodermatophilus pulveris TaxID=1564159 RepID=A0A239G530_9ACTN|nr:hypothetical protein [Geodermatophilus pulveris]SNS63742.1 hypothetical protein SAMN06893096_10610 [Geodermatophilus pulveris]